MWYPGTLTDTFWGLLRSLVSPGLLLLIDAINAWVTLFQPILITKSERSLNKPSKRPKSQRHLPHLQPIQKCAQISFQNALTGSWRSYGALVRLGATSQTILHVALYVGTFLFWISGQIKWSEVSYNLLATVVGFICADANNRVAAPWVAITLLSVTSPTAGRFSQFFYLATYQQIYKKATTKYSGTS